MDKKRLVLLDIDGLSPETAYGLLADDSLNISRLLGRGLKVKRATTVFPSVTLCCQASMFTGAWPRTHSIVGNSWFVRGTSPVQYREYCKARPAANCFDYDLFGLPTLLLPERPGLRLADNDLSRDVKLIYEAASDKGLTSWAVFNQYCRGATRWVRPTRMEMIIFALCHEEKLDSIAWDRATVAHTAADLQSEGAPDLLNLYISGLDNHSHQHGPDAQESYFRRAVDPLLGHLIEVLDRLGALENTYFVLVSDHGQAEIVRQPAYVVNPIRAGIVLQAAEEKGFHLFDGRNFTANDNAVASFEAGAVQFHLLNRETGNWADAPRFEADILAAAAAFETYRDNDYPFVDLILVREHPAAEYQVYLNGELYPIEPFFADKDDKYPDAVTRLRGLNCPRSGDMIVGVDYEKGFYFGDKVKGGEHGSLRAEDSLVPFAVSGPGIEDRWIERASVVDLAPTMAELLELELPTAEGRSILAAE